MVTVPTVREELEDGVATHSYLQAALEVLGEKIPVVDLTDDARKRDAVFRKHVDPGEAQALAVAASHDGLLVTDDGDARALAIEYDVRLTGSIGILLEAVNTDRLNHDTADRYLKRWIDEAGFHAPARDLEDYSS